MKKVLLFGYLGHVAKNARLKAIDVMTGSISPSECFSAYLAFAGSPSAIRNMDVSAFRAGTVAGRESAA